MASHRFSSYEIIGTREESSAANSQVPLYLNVYDVTDLNGYCYWCGLGIFHTAIEAHGVEYAFGAHEYPITGIFMVKPRRCPGYAFRESIRIGTTHMNHLQFREFLQQIASSYRGDTYHLLLKNCNHFCDDVSFQLTGNRIPGWVNRLARLGWFCKCFLPDSLQLSAVPHKENKNAPPHETEQLQNDG
ncbi:hypothetical protein O6H91_13G076900 [Diphasiastrum complanatum]|uniref:Uncharacterized protein n=1 Tax=Diphasiastrum complanatum TaxID=34168 RepID=A0ACC2BXB6_DIPCM|nr:hypothetical protein O6H91_13G076900 [Diphasiastrum complanatum]